MHAWPASPFKPSANKLISDLANNHRPNDDSVSCIYMYTKIIMCYGIKILNLFILLFCKRIMFVYYNFQSRAHSDERLCGARDNIVCKC